MASIDVRDEGSGHWTCYSHAGQTNTGRGVHDWARELEDRGAGEILITSINRDGTMEGFDFGLIEAVVEAVDIPVIASGGAGTYDDMVRAVTQCGASAVAAASMFHYTEQTPAGAKAALERAGAPVRRLSTQRSEGLRSADELMTLRVAVRPHASLRPGTGHLYR